jgi:regulator of protease activity HflC (stomatin/prohibitin superfamily)
VTKYRKTNFIDIFDEQDLLPNSSHSKNLTKRCTWGVYFVPFLGALAYNAFHTETFVPAGHVGLFQDDKNNFLFAAPGMHNISSAFTKKKGDPVCVTSGTIIHGNRTICTVEQGKIGYATDRGQPILLPPGLHSWVSETLKFQQVFTLENHAIDLGPLTILTVDEGYAAITQNNGKQEILPGGETHLLPHQKWRFEKFITLKIQTDDLERIRAASADNIIMEVSSTVVWRIKDVHTAALFGADTMASSGKAGEVSADITKLRRDVLKQAIASLASFIGSVNYSDSFHVAAAAQRQADLAMAEASVVDSEAGSDMSSHGHGRIAENPMFDVNGISEAVSHANRITIKYGVEIVSINIISANPVDKNLTESLASGAVASAEALQAETAARGKAKAIKISAEATALETIILAKADADAMLLEASAAAEAEEMRAEGSKKAAELLSSNPLAGELAKIDRSAGALKSTDKFFFANSPEYMKNVVMPVRAMGGAELDM